MGAEEQGWKQHVQLLHYDGRETESLRGHSVTRCQGRTRPCLWVEGPFLHPGKPCAQLIWGQATGGQGRSLHWGQWVQALPLTCWVALG